MRGLGLGLLVGWGAMTALGLGLALVAAPSAERDAEVIQSLPVFDAVAASPPGLVGARVLMHGALEPLPSTALGDDGFVAYREEKALRIRQSGASKGTVEWQRLNERTPEFRVGAVRVTGSYLLLSGSTWMSDPFIRVPRDVFDDRGTRRLTGFRSGQAVTVDGRLEETAPGQFVVHASAVAGGEVAAYRELVSGSGTTLRVAGASFAGIALLVLGVPGVLVLRLSRGNGQRAPRRRESRISP